MGNQGSKTDVFYTVSTATNQKAAEKLVNKLTEDLKKANLQLKPRPGPQAKGPTLQIRESTNDWKFKDLCEESQDLEHDVLMLVLTSQVDQEYRSDRLVQIKCTANGLDKSGSHAYSSCVHLITSFLLEGGRTQQHSGSLTRGAATRETTICSTVDVAFGDAPDYLVKDAVKFLEVEGRVTLVKSPNIHQSSPLLVICKNDTQLQEDIRHATQNTRGGTDVMLIVITDRKDQLLQDTEATKPFGAKACLVFDQFRQKFGYTGNEKTLKWIRSFLEKYDIQMDLKMNRKSSLRKSWANFKTSEVVGSYYVVGNLSEERLKNIVIYFSDKNVALIEADHENETNLMIIFCEFSDLAELSKCIKDKTDDVQIVIIHRESQTVSPVSGLPCYHYSLALEDLKPKVINNALNGKVVEGVRKFFKRRKAPSGRRPAAQSVFADPAALSRAAGDRDRHSGQSTEASASQPFQDEGMELEDGHEVMDSEANGSSHFDISCAQRSPLLRSREEGHGSSHFKSSCAERSPLLPSLAEGPSWQGESHSSVEWTKSVGAAFPREMEQVSMAPQPSGAAAQAHQRKPFMSPAANFGARVPSRQGCADDTRSLLSTATTTISMQPQHHAYDIHNARSVRHQGEVVVNPHQSPHEPPPQPPPSRDMFIPSHPSSAPPRRDRPYHTSPQTQSSPHTSETVSSQYPHAHPRDNVSSRSQSAATEVISAGDPSHRPAKTVGSWKRAKRQPRAALPGMQPDAWGREDYQSAAQDCSKDRGSRRRARDRNEDESSAYHDLADMFEGLTIKRKKVAPFMERKKEKELKQKEAVWRSQLNYHTDKNREMDST